MIDKFKPKLPRLPYPFIPPSIRRQNNHRIFHRRVLEATMKDPQAKTQVHVHHGGPEDWPWPPPPDEPVVIEAPPPLPNIIWPRLPPDHPYHCRQVITIR